MQEYNAQLIDQLATDFPKRLDASYAWGQVISGFNQTPNIRGFWASAHDEDWRFTDASGQGRSVVGDDAHLATIPTIGKYGIATYASFVRASSQFLFRPTETGLEITTGLTIWAWIRFHTESTGVRVDYLSKWAETAANERGFMLSKTAADVFNFNISTDGTAVKTSSAVVADYVINKWYFIAGRFTPSTEVALFVGNATQGSFIWYRNVAAIPATIFVNSESLMVGCGDRGANYLDGDETLFGIAAEALSDVHIWNLFSQSRPLFV